MLLLVVKGHGVFFANNCNVFIEQDRLGTRNLMNYDQIQVYLRDKIVNLMSLRR